MRSRGLGRGGLQVPPRSGSDDDDEDSNSSISSGGGGGDSPKISRGAMSKRLVDARGKKFDTRRAHFG